MTLEILVLELVSAGVEQTQQLGAQLGRLARQGDVFALQGELGSGKTNFVKGLARGLEIENEVHSPTFILANEYRGGRLPLYHIDAYRVANAAEAQGFGLDDYLNGDGIVVIEWAERIREALPMENLWIEFRHLGETERGLKFTAHGDDYVALLQKYMALINPLTLDA